jgi:hypothetical protein
LTLVSLFVTYLISLPLYVSNKRKKDCKPVFTGLFSRTYATAIGRIKEGWSDGKVEKAA